MAAIYLPCETDQKLLLPEALQEWLPEKHLAYFFGDAVDGLAARIKEQGCELAMGLRVLTR